jgi:hypothetical protein
VILYLAAMTTALVTFEGEPIEGWLADALQRQDETRMSREADELEREGF